MDKNVNLGQYIRDQREKLDMSLREFAKKIDCSPAFVSDIELGRRYPSAEVLTSMAKTLGVSVETLKSYDNRAPVEEMKRFIEQDPTYAFAFRKLLDKNPKPEEIIKFV